MSPFFAGKTCEDMLPDCTDYFNAQECEKYSGITRQYCAKSCNYCELKVLYY